MEGGIVRVWMHVNIDHAIVNVTIHVVELELKQDRLFLPNYVNVPKVSYFMFGWSTNNGGIIISLVIGECY